MGGGRLREVAADRFDCIYFMQIYTGTRSTMVIHRPLSPSFFSFLFFLPFFLSFFLRGGVGVCAQVNNTIM